MLTPGPPTSGTPPLIAISVGNTRTALARFEDGSLEHSERLVNDGGGGGPGGTGGPGGPGAPSAIVEATLREWKRLAASPRAAIVMASVNERLAKSLQSAIEDQLGLEVYMVGEDLPVPIGQQLEPETITGIDRLLNAAAAFETLKQACIVVDAGTAVTVDFVDGEGTFHGGAIAPGARMQLRALHEHTDALPEVEFRAPSAGEAFGRNTAEAMLQGVYHGIRGMVWRLVEHYAEQYGGFPIVVATGGDARLLFHDDELIDRIVPDLTLMGIAAAAKYAMAKSE